MTYYVQSSEIRRRFAQAMSEMYQSEVPKYGKLIDLVNRVNKETLEKNDFLNERLTGSGEKDRLNIERHGAIRVGTASELSMLRRLFSVMGMFPVGYYDLSEAGVPVHSTAFRPIEEKELNKNPFRIFTSLLRLDLIENKELRAHASNILSKRDIFTSEAKRLIECYQDQGGLTEEQAKIFVSEALETFRWHKDATVDYDTYQALHNEHSLIADVVCFRGPHINHLTPRTLDIDKAQRYMHEMGLNPKSTIEGPPRRQCPILLRQTSFKALEENILFSNQHHGSHAARFGEIEQRGIALTPKGRNLYDSLLKKSKEKTSGLSNEEHQRVLSDVFYDFPDNEETLRQKGLAYFEYSVKDSKDLTKNQDEADMETLIKNGLVSARPITYEDFLPVSAAGIFQSNLGDGQRDSYNSNESRASFEEALGSEIIDEHDLYHAIENQSITSLLKTINKKI